MNRHAATSRIPTQIAVFNRKDSDRAVKERIGIHQRRPHTYIRGACRKCNVQLDTLFIIDKQIAIRLPPGMLYSRLCLPWLSLQLLSVTYTIHNCQWQNSQWLTHYLPTYIQPPQRIISPIILLKKGTSPTTTPHAQLIRKYASANIPIPHRMRSSRSLSPSSYSATDGDGPGTDDWNCNAAREGKYPTPSPILPSPG